jgi:hypothetical protein
VTTNGRDASLGWMPSPQPEAPPAGKARPSGAGHYVLVKAPAVSLFTGGRAIRGIGQTFTANPVTVTASAPVPVATSAGRGGFGQKLALSSDAGAGNGSVLAVGAEGRRASPWELVLRRDLIEEIRTAARHRDTALTEPAE